MANIISDETIEYVGILAKLELSAEEKEQAKKDMGSMLDYIDKQGDLDTGDVEPMSHVFPVKNVFREKLSREMLGFLVTIVEKDRYSEIEAILGEVISSIKEYNNIGTAYVTTAIAINEQEKQDIESRLLATTRYKTIECIYDVDKSLIGGMVIKMGDRVVDSSIRTKLDKLQRELLAIQL